MRTPGRGRAAAAVDRRRASGCAGCCRSCSTRTSSSRRTASARCRGTTASIRTCFDVERHEHRVDYEPAESTHRPLRRQLELARADLVPGQLPADRVAAEVPPLLRRRLQGRVPDRLRQHDDALARSPPSSRAGLSRIFLRDANGRRPVLRRRRAVPDATRTGATCCCSTSTSTATTARGVGASHQTGWTGLVAKLLQQSGD